MEISKTTSKTGSLKALILKAWRERWNEIQWGINIKTILPRGVSGDVYNLADCILQQATVGFGANQLMISYLKHSLTSHLVSFAAVLQRVAKFDAYHKPHCVLALLDFLDRFLESITCRGKLEEGSLSIAISSVILWLLQVYDYCVTKYPSANTIQNQDLIDKSTMLLTAIMNSDFLLAMFYLAKHEDPDTYVDISKKCQEIRTLMVMNTQFKPPAMIHDTIQKICNMELSKIATFLETDNGPSVCLQAYIVIDVLVNPSAEACKYANDLMLIQRMKGYSNAKLYCELIKSSFVALSDASSSSIKQSVWGTFTFLKLPQIINQFFIATGGQNNDEGFCVELIEAFEMLLQYTSLLDTLDSKCNCNSVVSLLESLSKLTLVKEQHITYFKQKRNTVDLNLNKLEPSGLGNSIPIFINRAEPTLTGVLKSFNADMLKLQDTAIYAMLCQILQSKNLATMLTVACIDGKLKQFTSKLIKINEASYKNLTDANVNMHTKTGLFDVTFLILCAIVQEYGTDTVLEENSDSFFGTWVKECMVEKDNPKSPDQILSKCDQAKVDILLHHLSNPDFDSKSTHLKCHDQCFNIPGVMKEILFAWEQGSLSAADVKRMLDTLKLRMFSLAICAATWLCAYIDVVHQDVLLKPMNMVQQLLAPYNESETSQADNFKDRSNLMFQIIRKMQYDVYPPTSSKLTMSQTNSIVSKEPIIEQLKAVWKDVKSRGWLHVESTYVVENLLKTAGPVWFVSNMVKEILKFRYLDDLHRSADLIFSMFHLNIEKCTVALLLQILPQYLYNSQLSKDLVEPQCSVLAKLAVYCVYAALENSNTAAPSSRKRKFDELEDIEALCPTNKVRRLNDNTAESSTLFASSIPQSGQSLVLREPLLSAIENLFKAFSQLAGKDGDVTLQTYFIYLFIYFLVKCGGNKVQVILQKLPNDLVPTLIKTLPEKFNISIILRLYDMNTKSGRKDTARDLCLLRNMQLRPEF